MSSAPVVVALSRRTVSAFGVWAIGSATSAPIVVSACGISATCATSDMAGSTTAFVVVGATVGLLLVGYSAMLREFPHSAPCYAVVARGLSRNMGVAAGFVALLSYNALQISLYGLLGLMASSVAGVGAWWVWANLGIAMVAFLGRRRIELSAKAVITALVISLLALLWSAVATLSGSAGYLFTGHPFASDGLVAQGLGLTIALTVSAYAGVEGAGSLVEEERASGRRGESVRRGMMAAVASLTVLYIAVAWTVSVAPTAAESRLPLREAITLRDVIVGVAALVVISGILAPLIAFHHVISRYVFSIAREHVLPPALACSGSSAVAPVRASRLQTAFALLVVNGFAIVGTDPARTLFGWLSTLGAMGVLVLLIATNIAALNHFARRSRTAGAAWGTLGASLVGVTLGTAVLAVTLWQLTPLLRADASSSAPYLVPAVIVMAGTAGLVRAVALRRTRPALYRGIGYGVPQVYDVPDVIHPHQGLQNAQPGQQPE